MAILRKVHHLCTNMTEATETDLLDNNDTNEIVSTYSIVVCRYNISLEKPFTCQSKRHMPNNTQ